MPEHARHVFLLEVFLLSPQSQVLECIAHAFLQQTGKDLERRLYGMLFSLAVPLFETLGEVDYLPKAIGKG